MGEELGRLVGNRIPRGTGVGADVDRSRGVVRCTNEDSRSSTIDGLRSLIKGNKSQSLEIAVVRVALRTRAEGADSVERRHLGEIRAAVGGLPQSVPTPGTKENDLGVLGVDSKALTHASTRHIAANLEGKCRDLPGLALIRAAGKGSIVGIPKNVSKRALRKVDGEKYQSLVYIPVAMYTLFASAGSRANASTPHRFQLPSWAKPFASVTGVQELSSLSRYRPPMSVRAKATPFSVGWN